MTRPIRAWLALSCGFAATALIPLAATPAATGAPDRAPRTAIAPPGHHAATEPTLMDLLAGSPNYLVYALGDQLAGGAHVGDQPPSIDGLSEHLYVRTKSGHTIDLGHAPKGLQPKMSLSGPMLTGFAQKPDFSGFRGAFWWNIATGKSGEFTLPDHATYRSAAPHGAVISKGRKLFTLSTNGTRKPLGVPFPHQPGLQVTAADHGIVVLPFFKRDAAGPPAMAYLRFAHPGDVRRLQTRGSRPIFCPSLNNVVAGCVAEDRRGAVKKAELIPLTGKAPTTTSQGKPGPVVALDGQSLLWSSSSGLRSIRLHQPKVLAGPPRFQAAARYDAIAGTDPFAELHEFSGSSVTAYGHAVFTHHTGATQLELATSVHDARVIFTRPMSEASVAAFALTPNRVSYISDQKRRHGHGRFSTYTSKVMSSSQGTALGKPALVHGNTDYQLVGSSKQVEVYSTNRTKSEEHSELTVVDKDKRHTIKHVPFDGYLGVSGSRVMFPTDRNLADPGSSAVYDAATGTTTFVDTQSTCCDPDGATQFRTSTPALSGHMVFFVRADGTVIQHDLTNGQETALSDPVSGARGGIVFAAGKYVAWRIKGSDGRVNAYRDLSTMSQPVQVNGQIFGISAAGVLVTPGIPRNGGNGRVGYDAAFDLLRFNGKRTTVIAKQNEYVLPRLAGSVVAWVAVDGLLRIRFLD